MSPAPIHKVFVRKIVFLGPLCDACFKRTLNCITGQVISARIRSTAKKNPRFFDSELRQLLQVASVHLALQRQRIAADRALLYCYSVCSVKDEVTSCVAATPFRRLADGRPSFRLSPPGPVF